jgi:hypothetical protein
MCKQPKPARRDATDHAEYSGPLAEPIRFPSWLASDAQKEEFSKTLANKMRLLMQHFGIDSTGSNAFVKLSWELAHRHVPGFMPPPTQRGRPREHAKDDFKLYLLFELLKRRDGIAGRPASEVIAKSGAIQGTPETLRTRMKNWKRKYRRIVEFFNQMAARAGPSDYIDGLEAAVGDLLQKR